MLVKVQVGLAATGLAAPFDGRLIHTVSKPAAVAGTIS